MRSEKIESEFFRILDILMSQHDIDVIDGMIPYAEKKRFVKSWKEG